MADAYRFPQQSAGSYFYPQHTQQHHPRQQIIRNSTPPNNIRSLYNAESPSPPRSPESHSPGRNLYGMFNQSHQQGQHGRVNGGPGRGMPMMFNFQHQNPQQHHTHSHNHANIQQDHGAHQTNGAILGHHATFSSGVLSNATPSFTPNALPNGHSATTRGGQAVQINDHWAKQLELHKESEKAHAHMIDGAPNHFARLKAGENKGIAPIPAPDPDTQDSDEKDLSRMSTQSTKQRQDWFNLDLSGQGIKVLAEPVFKYDFLKQLYVASNKLTKIPPSIRHLRSLQHLDASNNQLTELPPELGMCVFLKNLLVFDNSIQSLPNELGSLFHLEILGIEGNPLAPDLKQEIMERGTKSLVTLLQNQAPTPMPPNSRETIELQEGDSNAGQEKFKVYSFNILSDQACTPKMYGYSPAQALEWEYRKDMILADIQGNNADFVCLQEVDTDTYETFRMKLAYNEYKGAFWPRSRSKTMGEKEAKLVDGCATFYKKNKYILLDKQLIDFAAIAINRPDMKSHHDIFNRVMPRDHIGVVTFFENRQTGTRLILVNTHIFWDPAYADVKLVQTAILISEVNKLAEKYASWPACRDKKAYGLADEDADQDVPPEPTPQPSKEYMSKTQIPLVICADQNSTPDSSVFELLAKGAVRANHPEFGGRSYGNFSKDGMEHPFSLRSAYTNLDNTPDAVPFTNYVPTFKGVIDHIWYSTNALENISLLGQVDPEYMKTVPGFPNFHFPSDHLSLMAEFAVKGAKPKKAITEPDFGPSSRSNDRRRN